MLEGKRNRGSVSMRKMYSRAHVYTRVACMYGFREGVYIDVTHRLSATVALLVRAGSTRASRPTKSATPSTVDCRHALDAHVTLWPAFMNPCAFAVCARNQQRGGEERPKGGRNHVSFRFEHFHRFHGALLLYTRHVDQGTSRAREIERLYASSTPASSYSDAAHR